MNKTNIDYSYHNMILGKPGTGKTHLIYSEIKRILQLKCGKPTPSGVGWIARF